MPELGADVRQAVREVLTAQPGQTARQISWALRQRGILADKGAVNSIVYRNADFVGDGAVPPRWSVAGARPATVARATNRLAAVAVQNWKVFERAVVPAPGVTLLFGENSSGKSSIIQALLLLRQSWGTGDLRFDGPGHDFDRFQNVVHDHDLERPMSLSAIFGSKADGEAEWRLHVTAARDDELAFGPAQPVAEIACRAGDDLVVMTAVEYATPPGTDTSVVGAWAVRHVAPGDELQLPFTDGEALLRRGDIMLVHADENEFPDLTDPVGTTGDTARHRRTLATAAHLLAESGRMVEAIVHIGPFREVPTRSTDLAWAREHTEYLARLYENPELVSDVNEWLARFELPFGVSIEQYGDDLFDLMLVDRDDASRQVHLRDVGFGVSQLLPIITQLIGHREKTILLEEPEAHVHPRLQSRLADLFMTSTQDYGNVLLVETHSEPVLLRLQRRVAEARLDVDDLAVVHVVRQGSASVVEPVPVGPDGRLDYQWPGGFFDDRMDDLVAILDPGPGA